MKNTSPRYFAENSKFLTKYGYVLFLSSQLHLVLHTACGIIRHKLSEILYRNITITPTHDDDDDDGALLLSLLQLLLLL